ncbi:MAG: tachylectin-related carbohydrate-binding protein [Chitinophagales bacterium]
MKNFVLCLAITLLFSTSIFAQRIGQSQQGLSALSGGVWPNKTCEVCWENANNGNMQERTWVRDAVARTWERESEFRTTGWGNCNANSRGVRILIIDSHPHVNALGSALDGMMNGMELNFTFNNWECNDATTNPAMRRDCIELIAVHEFGHALGFAHEQNRTDAPLECQKDAQGTNGDWWITPYDAESIMNYCSPAWNNDGMLSEKDIAGVRQLYGGPGYITEPIIYATSTDNSLLWYKHTGYGTGKFEWSANTGTKVGSGWNFKFLFNDGNGYLYGVTPSGDLMWYGHNGYHTGSFNWALASASKVGNGWAGDTKAVFSGGKGVIYLLKENGDLFWYKHLGYKTGKASWHPKSGTKIGNGWNVFKAIFSGGNGVFYGIKENGDLAWYRHTGLDNGASTWLGGFNNKIGNGWLSARQVFSTGDGNIYLVNKDNGNLYYYRHLGVLNGTASWGSGTGNQVGTGWKGVKAIGMGSWYDYTVRVDLSVPTDAHIRKGPSTTISRFGKVKD